MEDLVKLVLLIISHTSLEMSNLSPFGGGKNPPWVRNAGKYCSLLLMYVLLSSRVQDNNVAKSLL